MNDRPLEQRHQCIVGNLGAGKRWPGTSRRPAFQNARPGQRAFWWGLLWEPRDLWLGVYWNRPKGTGWSWALDVYVCVIPCLPFKLECRRMLPVAGVQASG